MKRFFLAIVVAGLVTSVVQAQEIPERKRTDMRRSADRKHGRESLQKLNLTEEQKTKFKAENDNYRSKMADLRKQDQLTVKESREKMAQLRKEHRANTQSLLTNEQKAQLEAGREKRKETMLKRSAERNEKMKKNLGLTAEQSAKLDASRKSLQEKTKALRENKTLDETEKRKQLGELRKQQAEEMKKVLTAEQLQKMKESRKRPAKKMKS